MLNKKRQEIVFNPYSLYFKMHTFFYSHFLKLFLEMSCKIKNIYVMKQSKLKITLFLVHLSNGYDCEKMNAMMARVQNIAHAFI